MRGDKLRPDGRPVSSGRHGLGRIFGSLLELLNAVGTAMILAMMVLLNVDILGRNVFNKPLPGVVIVFLQAAHMLRKGRMLRSDGMLNMLRLRHTRTAALIDILVNTLGAALFFILANAMRPRIETAWVNGLYKGNLGGFTVPIWPLEVAILIGAFLTAVQFLLNVTVAMRVAFGPQEPKVS